MGLAKSKGNMYDFVTHTWNPISGKCIHNCEYCYMHKYPLGDLKLDKQNINTNLGSGKFIFIGSACDMFAEDVPEEWIKDVLKKCVVGNKYLFQSKNPARMSLFDLPKDIVLGTTIETNRVYPQMGKTVHPLSRAHGLYAFAKKTETMITIEPIMDFDLKPFVEIIKFAEPSWVNIGADSKGHNLHEPSKEKILSLVEEISKFTVIRKKVNLERILETFEKAYIIV